MRVTTDLWVSALVRRALSSSGFAAILQRGATEAGAVFVLTRDRFGEVTLYGPALQTSYDNARPDERLFGKLETTLDEEVVIKRLEREKKFDPDIWVVEIEPGSEPVEELIAIRTP